jgi:hypothetical protein
MRQWTSLNIFRLLTVTFCAVKAISVFNGLNINTKDSCLLKHRDEDDVMVEMGIKDAMARAPAVGAVCWDV